MPTAEPGLSEPGGLEPGLVGFGPTVIVRRPWLEVKIGGVVQPEVLEAACHFGFDQRYATAEIRFRATVGVDLSYWMPVEITMGASVETAISRFFGYILPVDNQSWVPGGTLHCRGPLGVAATFGNWDQNEIVNDTLYGTDFSYILLTGTVAKTAGSPDVIGTGTAFTTELSVGQVISIPGPTLDPKTNRPALDARRILTIDDDTHLTTDSNFVYTGSNLVASRSGRTDQEIVNQILTYYGLTTHFTFTAPQGVSSDTVQGSGVYIGNNNASFDFEPLIWKRGQTGLDFIEFLDQNCVGAVWPDAVEPRDRGYGLYRTFESVGAGGSPTIFRRLITANPQETASPQFSLTEGVDLLRDTTVTHDPTQVVNSIRVIGYDDGIGPNMFPQSPDVYLAASSFYLPSWMPNGIYPYPMVGQDVSFPLGERETRDEQGDGFSCEDKAQQQLLELNTEVVTVKASTYRDDWFGPGQTIYVYAPTRLGVFQNMWLNRLDITMNAQRVFRQQLELIVKN